MIFKSYSAIALDFDGTVSDSMPVQEENWKQAVFDICENPEAIWKVIRRNLYDGKAGEKMFEGLEYVGVLTKKALRVRKDSLWHSIRESVPLLPGATCAIQKMAQRYRLFIATTADYDYVYAVLKREGLDKCFHRIYTNADVTYPKPAPDMLNVILRDIGAEPNRLLMIGDAVSDAIMACAARCSFLHLSHDGRSTLARFYPVAILQSWDEIVQHLNI